jgi:hypothetical protein
LIHSLSQAIKLYAIQPFFIFYEVYYLCSMEPIVTEDGFKMLQNPEESRSLLNDYYTSLGFKVADACDADPGFSNMDSSAVSSKASNVDKGLR